MVTVILGKTRLGEMETPEERVQRGEYDLKIDFKVRTRMVSRNYKDKIDLTRMKSGDVRTEKDYNERVSLKEN